MLEHPLNTFPSSAKSENVKVITLNWIHKLQNQWMETILQPSFKIYLQFDFPQICSNPNRFQQMFASSFCCLGFPSSFFTSRTCDHEQDMRFPPMLITICTSWWMGSRAGHEFSFFTIASGFFWCLFSRINISF